MTATRRPRAETQAETRRRLIEAAANLFEANGFHSTSVAQIAKAAGFTTGAIYSNFGGKEELAEAVVAASQAESWEALATALASHDDFADRLVAVVRWHAHLVTAKKPIMLLRLELWHLSAHNPAVRDALSRNRRILVARFAELLRQQASDVGADLTIDAGLLAASLIALADGGAVSRELDTEEHLGSSFAWGMATLVLDALEPTPIPRDERPAFVARILDASVGSGSSGT